jgi:hypothetical protein
MNLLFPALIGLARWGIFQSLVQPSIPLGVFHHQFAEPTVFHVGF